MENFKTWKERGMITELHREIRFLDMIALEDVVVLYIVSVYE